MSFLHHFRFSVLLAVAVATVSISSVASAYVRSEIPDSYDEFDGIDLAVKLAEDGKFKLAEKVLKAVPSNTEKSSRKSRANRERILGLLVEDSANGNGDLEKASVHFANALKLFDSPEFHFDKQRVDFARQEYASCTNSVRTLINRDRSIVTTSSPSRIRIAVRCLRLSDQSTEALNLLFFAMKQQPNLKLNSALASEQVEVLFELGLHEAGTDFAIETMKAMSVVGQIGISSFALDLVERVKLGDNFFKRRFNEKILEAAQVFSTKNEQEDVLAARAKTFYSQGKSLTSAMAFERLLKLKSDQTSQVYLATVELYRLSGWRGWANHLAQYIDEPKDRLRARVSGFFERSEMAKIAAMFPSLDRHLLDEEEWIYLGAFARLQSGGWHEDGATAPARWLSKLKRPENREKATVLRQLVADCRDGKIQACAL